MLNRDLNKLMVFADTYHFGSYHTSCYSIFKSNVTYKLWSLPMLPIHHHHHHHLSFIKKL